MFLVSEGILLQMAGPELIDIAPLSEIITVRGYAVTLRPLGIPACGTLITRFPELATMLGGGKRPGAAEVLALGDDVTAAIIALAAPDQLTEASANNLALGERAELLEPIVRMTMPRGFGPFAESLAKLMQTVQPPAQEVAVNKARASRGRSSG